MNNKSLSPFAQSLLDRKALLNDGKAYSPWVEDYITWGMVAKEIGHKEKTMLAWIHHGTLPHAITQKDAIVRFDAYIEKVIRRRKTKARKSAYMKGYRKAKKAL